MAVVAAPTAQAQTPIVTSVIGAADGLSVDLAIETPVPDNNEVAAQELFNLSFGPEPTVTLPPTGGSVSESVANVDESAGPIALVADLLTAAADGALGPDGFATAETSVADIFLGEALPLEAEAGAQQNGLDILVADLITATCSADLGGVAGSTTLADASVLGETLEAEPDPNTEFVIVVNGF
ncbi:MAG TPA: choice-of-anchor P family protein, partial [Acidimicrobiia bacterium]